MYLLFIGTHRVEADTMIDDRHTSFMVMEEIVTDTGPLPLGSGDMHGVEEGMLLEEALEVIFFQPKSSYLLKIVQLTLLG